MIFRVLPGLDYLAQAKIFDDRRRIFAEDFKALPGKGLGPFGGIENGADGAVPEGQGNIQIIVLAIFAQCPGYMSDVDR